MFDLWCFTDWVQPAHWYLSSELLSNLNFAFLMLMEALLEKLTVKYYLLSIY